jgi:hypothetical protein
MADDEVAESYEANTVEELREELRARDLPVSGHKDELVARLEEDDAGGEATEEAPATTAEASAVVDEGKRVYSPYELPANTAAAQAFTDANPESVDASLTLPPEQQAAAEANIQDHVDMMAAMGVTVEDPRLGGAVGAAATPSPK